MKEIYFTPAQAWLGSLTRVLLWPLAVLASIALLGLPFLVHASVLLLFAGLVGMVVHFAAYMVIGLLIYQVCWNDCPLLWSWKIGLPLGMVVGGVTTSALVILAEGTWNPPGTDILPVFMIGGLYGLVTAAAAINTGGRSCER